MVFRTTRHDRTYQACAPPTYNKSLPLEARLEPTTVTTPPPSANFRMPSSLTMSFFLDSNLHQRLRCYSNDLRSSCNGPALQQGHHFYPPRRTARKISPSSYVLFIAGHVVAFGCSNNDEYDDDDDIHHHDDASDQDVWLVGSTPCKFSPDRQGRRRSHVEQQIEKTSW
jgi:hypothetical protein